MNKYENSLKENLFSIIDEMEKHSRDFVVNPEKDCIRNRKLGFVDFIKFTLSLGAKSTNNELLSYFRYSQNTPTASAFNQQKAKIKPETFKYLLDKFTENLPQTKTHKGYRLIACDGSDINIARGKAGDNTYISSGNKRGYSLMHLSAFYDILNGLYLDAEITPKREKDEKYDCVKMIDRSKIEKVLLLADRGYETFNIFAYAMEKNWKFLIRAKDIDVKYGGIAYGCHLGLEEFPPEEIKRLYNMRWGIETSFREVKYYIGMINLHSKKQNYISQEIYARMVVYNFCKAVMNHVDLRNNSNNKYSYKLNTVAAVSVCRDFLFGRYVVLLVLEMLLKRYLTPIRSNRSFPRKVADKKPVSFNYRQA